jgi:hypothetical protein
MKIDYCLVGSDTNPFYYDFWPVISRVWKDKFNITPVLGLICDEDSDLFDDGNGLVKKFKPSNRFNIGTQSQIVRMYLSKYLNGNCIISDIDMIPLSKKYFIDDMKKYKKNDLVVMSSHHPQTNGTNQYPMCYVAGHSSIFNKIFKTNLNWDDFLNLIPDNGWYTDQVFLYESIQKYGISKVKFPYRSFNNDRLDRCGGGYNENLIKEGFYVDSHLLRPYQEHKIPIDKLISLI